MINKLFKRFGYAHTIIFVIINFLFICYFISFISFFDCHGFGGSLSLRFQCSSETPQIIVAITNMPSKIMNSFIFYIFGDGANVVFSFLFILFMAFGQYVFVVLAIVDIFTAWKKKVKLDIKISILLITDVLLIIFALVALISWAIPELPHATESFIENLSGEQNIERMTKIDNEKISKENDINIKNGLEVFKCEILTQNDYENNLIVAQQTEDINISKQHLRWAIDKLTTQGVFLKTIEPQSEVWQKELDMIIEHYIDGTITNMNNEIEIIEQYSIKDQKEIINGISSNMQSGRTNIITIFSNINCD